jgi:hypothetical protein
MLMTAIDGAIQVESFELSPRNRAVMTTLGCLQRTFPGSGLALDRVTFQEDGLQDALAHTIARMSRQPVAGTKPKIVKAGQQHDEDRDTTDPKIITDPKLITELLMSVLHPRSVDIQALQIHKCTREEVMWSDCRSPWRRSALWLFVRVILQIAFRRLSDTERWDELYEHFMVYFMASIVSNSHQEMGRENVYVMSLKAARWLRKLNLSHAPGWFDSVQSVLKQAGVTVQEEWRRIGSEKK